MKPRLLTTPVLRWIAAATAAVAFVAALSVQTVRGGTSPVTAERRPVVDGEAVLASSPATPASLRRVRIPLLHAPRPRHHARQRARQLAPSPAPAPVATAVAPAPAVAAPTATPARVYTAPAPAPAAAAPAPASHPAPKAAPKPTRGPSFDSSG